MIKICANCRWCTKAIINGYTFFWCVSDQKQIEQDESCRFWDGFDNDYKEEDNGNHTRVAE